MNSPPAEGGRRQWVRLAKNVFRLVILVLVIWGTWRAVGKSLEDFARQQGELRDQLGQLQGRIDEAREAGNAERVSELESEYADLDRQRFSLGQISVPWLLGAGLSYLLGMVPCWWFWHRTLRALGQRPTPLESLKAFYIGHLGKYVPGKALVVVLRTGLVSGPRVSAVVAATSVFVETLTMMAVGGMVAAVILMALVHENRWLLLAAIGLMICAGLPTLPPIFRRLVRLIQLRRAPGDLDLALQGLNFRLMLGGWLTIAAGWVLFGVSLWCVLRSLPGGSPTWAAELELLPLLTACVALAVVLGFLSLIPGGVGVRELVVTTLLAPQAEVGAVRALAAAVVLRLVWLLAELAASVILGTLVRSPSDAATPRPSPTRSLPLPRPDVGPSCLPDRSRGR